MIDDELTPSERERIRRMAACWKASPIPAPRRPAPRVPRWRAAPAGAISFASLFASFAYATAGGVVVLQTVHVVAEKVMTATDEGAATAPATHARPPRRPAGHDSSEARDAHVQADEPPTSPNPDGISDPIPSPDLEPPVRSRPEERSFVAPPTHGPVLDSVGRTDEPQRSAWQRAASALERHDAVEADRALAELARDSDQRTRDAARLARAQLWVSQGDRARARPVLRDLAAHGATAIIRKRALDLSAE